MADSTLGRANVELGADASKVAPQLEAAKAQVVEGVREIQQAVDAAPITPRVQAPGTGDDSAAYQASLQRLASRQADDQEEMWRRRAMARGTADLPTAGSTAKLNAHAKAAANAAGATGGFVESVKRATGPLGNAVGLIGSLIGRFNVIAAIGGAVVGTFLGITSALNRKTEAARAAARELGELQNKIDELNNSPVSKAFDPDPEGTDLKAKYAERANQLYSLYTEAAKKAYDAGKVSRQQQLEEEFRAKEAELLKEERLEMESLRRRETLNRNMAETSRKYAETERMRQQIDDLKKQLESVTTAAFGRMDVNIERLASLVEAMNRRVGRDG